MRKRTRAREYALQILYQIDITHIDYDISLNDFWLTLDRESIDEELKSFTGILVKGVVDNLKAIDEKISRHATNWQLKRMAFVDRNIMRMACYELVFRSDIPPKASINEAVELAKKYSGLEAGKFVNAVLDKIKSEQER